MSTQPAPETALQSIRDRISNQQVRIANVTSQLAGSANSTFGDPGEGTTGKDNARDQRSGAIGFVVDALEHTDDLLAALEYQAGRFQFLA